MLVILLAVAFLLPAATQLQANDDIDLAFGSGQQDEFDDFVRDVGIAFSYIPAATAEPHGLIGFDIGADVSVIELNDEKNYMDLGFEGSSPSTFVLPRLRASKGLPFATDVEAFVSGDPAGNVRLFGGAVKHSFIEGGLLRPSAAVRLHGTMLTGVSDLDLFTYGADLSVSYKVPFLTPYAGASYVQIEGSENIDAVDLDDVSEGETRYFVGGRFSLGFINFVGQADFSEVDIYTLRANIGF